MTSLSLLDLSINNKVSSLICMALLRCQSIKQVTIANCKLSVIPIEFQMAEHNIEMTLKDNPLTSPPAGIAEKGPKALAAYWADLRADSTELDRMRLMLVGFGGVGKTTLAKALQTEHAGLAQFQLGLKGIPDVR